MAAKPWLKEEEEEEEEEEEKEVEERWRASRRR